MNHERVLAYATEVSRSSKLHGPAHWARVAEIGAQLVRETPGADPHVVELFAALHDAQRLSDGHDPRHGRRAAELALELEGILFEVRDEQLTLLVEAIATHPDGFVSEDPTIGVCFDADRLDLRRCGIRPHPGLLSTPAARRRVGAA
jgi:uncharacterized protein